MAIACEELKRRIEAARVLRGLTQSEIGRRFEKDGLGLHDVARIERGDMQAQRIHIDALVRHLEMPEWWFTAETLQLADMPPRSLQEQLGIIEGLVRQLVDDRAPAPGGELRRELEGETPNPQDRRESDSDQGTDARRGNDV